MNAAELLTLCILKLSRCHQVSLALLGGSSIVHSHLSVYSYRLLKNRFDCLPSVVLPFVPFFLSFTFCFFSRGFSQPLSSLSPRNWLLITLSNEFIYIVFFIT